jgi:RNA recognition motif-containing protein
VDNKKVFIGGLNYDTTEAGLKDYLEAYIDDGQSVINVRIIKDHETSKSRGFGFVTFSEYEHKVKALELDGSKLDGRFIGIKPALDKRQR